MCDNVRELVAELNQQQVVCSEVVDAAWGLLAYLTLPGGGKLGIYQPRHIRPGALSTKS